MSEIQGMKVQPGVPQQHATRAVFFIGGFGAASWAPLVPLLKTDWGLRRMYWGCCCCVSASAHC